MQFDIDALYHFGVMHNKNVGITKIYLYRIINGMITYFNKITIKFDFNYYRYTVYISKIIYVVNVANVKIFLFKMISLELSVQT